MHSLSGIARRLLSPPQAPPRPWSSLLSITGYATALLFFPIHFLTHRVYPTTPSLPILAVGPAELDFEFVKLGLQTWPWRSWLLYAGLVGCVVLHAADGMGVLWNTWVTGRGRLTKASRRQQTGTAFVAFVLPVLSGLLLMSREPLMVFSSTARRFEAVFTKSFVYRM